jgi:hypothetical protein
MAGSTRPERAPYPNGRYQITLGPFTVLAAEGDTAGLKTMAIHKAQFDFNVKEAYLSMKEGSWVDGAGSAAQIAVVDDSASPLTIVAALSTTTAHDAGTATKLTVADEGPILTGAELHLEFDNDTDGVVNDCKVELFVEPIYAPTAKR